MLTLNILQYFYFQSYINLSITMFTTKLMANYWILNQLGGAKRKWNTLEHNGVLFPPEYEKHDVPVIYQGQEIILDTESEEVATLYAKYMETDYVKSRIFNKNFWTDWRQILGDAHIIQNLEDVDFRQIYEYLLKKKEEKKLNPEDKEIKKSEEEKYKYAIVDGKEQPVGNFRIEPPGIFLGRGCNPKLGKVKRRIYPEDIIINIGADAKVPDPLPGHQWKDVIHDKTVEWLASWKDDITGKMKYVWLGAQSDLKAKSDINKFDLARKLKRRIKEIRTANDTAMQSDDPYTRQIATALYFIDNFALRVGNEKGEDEADTVGVTSLRVEHIELLGKNQIKLDFLGKDSVRYNRTVEVSPQVYKNIQEFMQNKSSGDQLFDLINPNDINKYLQSFMKNLTAKVFRTYNASYLFQKELNRINKKFDSNTETDKINLLLDEFNKANAKVAMLCNHQKNVNKSTNKQLERLDQMIKTAKQKLRQAKKSKKKNPERIANIEKTIKKLQAKKLLKTELKNISLGTSKINYIDPRITVAFLKKHDLPIDKIFSKTLQEKFKWAMDTDINFVF
ncbi:dna topoisomerase 1b [Tupanvirus deep ocean]|uniref:Dna topoisomerase 1b n=2 Tax=Tupanvirus TaxID=2094720 RepID=A0AC62A8U9_9VIRU|nr:dna topoisomerase 1b [Tupanvirus deep ocean]QKU34043.1 dna topoisomerase 1b [Tupanvirus deep ocean]